MCAVIGIICVISGAFPEFQNKKEALRVASGALIFPALVGAYLLRRLKAEILGEVVHQPLGKKA